MSDNWISKRFQRHMSQADFNRYLKRYHDGDLDALKIIIATNLGLVKRIALIYSKDSNKLSFDDLFHEGVTGLIRAIEKFDPGRGYQFSTYATHWIRQAISTACKEFSSDLRRPRPFVEKINSIRRASSELGGRLGRDPSDQELADFLGLEVESLRRYLFLNDSSFASSLDDQVGDDGSRNLHEMLPDDSLDNLDSVMISAQDLDALLVAMRNALDEREFRIISERFGLNGGKPMSLREIGEGFGVSRERIRQIEALALRKLREALLG